jgi:hypothetical protein
VLLPALIGVSVLLLGVLRALDRLPSLGWDVYGTLLVTRSLAAALTARSSNLSVAGHSICAMDWGTVELEPEVRDWLEALPTQQFAAAAFYVDLLAERGPLLGEPYTRQLDGKLRELRFHLEKQAVRITYWIAPGRRIVLLTTFVKTRMRESREVARARRALARCIGEEHTVEEDEFDGQAR